MCGSLRGKLDVSLSLVIDGPLPPEAGGCTLAEEEGDVWSKVVVCRETISTRVRNASYVWETISCARGMSALGSWAQGAGICQLASLCLALGHFWGIPLPTP